MSVTRFTRVVCAILLTAVAACRGSFDPAKFRSAEALYRAALAEYRQRDWGNAATGFERLTLELPARDPLMPRALFYLGTAQANDGQHLLAAQSFSRLAQSFPEDSLADDALLAAGKAYARLWRKPTLDPQYGEDALSTLRTLQATYPKSPLIREAEREISRLNQWFASKLYENGMHYLRRKAYDSAIIYFRDVARLYPDTPRAREALLRLVQAYRAINYKEDASEVCSSLRRTYPGNAEVTEACGSAPKTASSQRR